MPTAYHVTVASLFVGDTIEAGRFGKSARSAGPGWAPPNFNWTSLLWEMALESARIAVASHAPSRLDCTFACEKLSDARSFRDRHREGGEILVVDFGDDVPVFRGDLNLLSGIKTATPYLDYMPEIATQYWTNETKGMVELLIGGPVKVTSNVPE